jgi:hypothetical protein
MYRKTDLRFGNWNVTSHYWSGSLTAAARELAGYKLDLLGVKEFRCDKEGIVRAGDYNFLYVKKKRKIINWEEGFLYTTE